MFFVFFFLQFFKILIFWLVSGVKRQKMAQNDKILSVPLYISGSISFLVHMCKMVTSPDAFLIFSKFWFSFQVVVGGGGGGERGVGIKRAKNSTKWQKNYVPFTLYLRNRISYDCGFWYACVKWWYLQQVFSLFQNVNFLVVQGVKRTKNDPKLTILSLMLFISGTVDHIIKIFGTQVQNNNISKY